MIESYQNGAGKEIIIGGDFDIYMNGSKKSMPKILQKLMDTFLLNQLIKDFTRLSEKDSIIDLIITIGRIYKSDWCIPINIIDHMSIYIVQKNEKDSYPKIKFEGRSYYNFDEQHFIELLLREDWNFNLDVRPLDKGEELQ